MNDELRVIDFFCGAGGFSEGFRQQGFKVIKGIDNWRPAILTHNLNHHLFDDVDDVLTYRSGVEKILALPEAEIIIGSPPCVNFSMANNAGKADKSLGIELIETYLRIVAVHKHRKKSVLKAWLMENVPNSRNFVKDEYSFSDLALEEWARTNSIDPEQIALRCKNNGDYLIASDYGSPQSRQRFVCGEIITSGLFPCPERTHGNELIPIPNLGQIKRSMPRPTDSAPNKLWTDPNYPQTTLTATEISDHFYDTGLFEIEWLKAKEAKVNHPFMGKMSFPEDENRPSRTVMATRSGSTRESLIYKSEIDRVGDGEYRLPTIREASTLMGFPYTYQFTGGEGSKWRQIGNAVCPHMASALAKKIRKELGLTVIEDEKIVFPKLDKFPKDFINLNYQKNKIFSEPPLRKNGAKFRMHPFKADNLTVTLTNFIPSGKSNPDQNGKEWYASLFVGSGKTYSIIEIDNQLFSEVDKVLTGFPHSQNILDEIQIEIISHIPSAKVFQAYFENNLKDPTESKNPVFMIGKLAFLIEKFNVRDEIVTNLRLTNINKANIHLIQLIAIWAIFKVVQKTRENNNVNDDLLLPQVLQPNLI